MHINFGEERRLGNWLLLVGWSGVRAMGKCGGEIFSLDTTIPLVLKET